MLTACTVAHRRTPQTPSPMPNNGGRLLRLRLVTRYTDIDRLLGLRLGG
jgi:hypothetical protein